jgi:hypothetical protein
MAEKQRHHVKIGDRVRIKDSVTHMYPRARVYNEGFVRALEHDKLGYPLIYVEWDRDHWAHSGEDDGWTDEAHFDLVEDQMADQDERFDALLSGLSNLLSSFQNEEKQDSAQAVPVETPQGETNMTYDEVLAKATADAQDGDAFIVLVARPEEFSGTEILAPHIYVHSKREDAALMLDACMADAVAQTYAGLVMKLIAEAKSNARPDS